MPGVTVTVSDRCVGCGTCNQEVCFVDAIHLEGQRSLINEEACRGCGRCVSVCPEKAIDISIEFDQYIESTIQRISPLVDLS